EEEEKISALLGNTTINGQFDANSMPTQMDLNLSKFKMRDDDNRLNLNDLSFNFHSHQSAKGLQLGDLSFKIGHSDLSQDNFQVSLDGFGIKLEGEEAQDGVINYNWHSQIDKFVFPTPLGIGKMAWISYAEKSAVRRLDEGALLDLQTTARELRSQNNKPINIGFIMLDKLMAVSPQLLARSPFKQIGNNPLILLTVLKENFSKHVENREKPLQIDTELEFLLTTEGTQALGKLPTLSIKTKIDSDGFGKSNLIFPAFQRVVPEKGLIDWKGLNLHFTFTDKNMTVMLNLAGLLF
ncbi:hypothetical protein THIOM_002214, partial [Candidatus Thiomargarita nelsonii]